MSFTKYERETSVNFNDDETDARVYTANRALIRRLTANAGATLVESGEHEGSPWAVFTMPKRLVSFRQPSAKRQMTPEQREAARERLRAARQR